MGLLVTEADYTTAYLNANNKLDARVYTYARQKASFEELDHDGNLKRGPDNQELLVYEIE